LRRRTVFKRDLPRASKTASRRNSKNMAHRPGKTPEGDQDRHNLIDQCAEALRSADHKDSMTVERTIHVRRVIDGAEVEAVVEVALDKITLSVIIGRWDDPATCMRCLRPWRNLYVEKVKAEGGVEVVIPPLVDEALEARAEEFFTCRYCGEKIAPEHGDDDACLGCLSEHEGRVY